MDSKTMDKLIIKAVPFAKQDDTLQADWNRDIFKAGMLAAAELIPHGADRIRILDAAGVK